MAEDNDDVEFVDDDDDNLDNSDIDHIGMSSSQEESTSDGDSDNNNNKINNRADSLDEYGDEKDAAKYKSEILAETKQLSTNLKSKNATYTMDTIDSGNGGDLKFDDGKLLKSLDITDLFSQVDYIQTKLQQSANKSLNDDIILLRKLYQTIEFQNALILYNKLVNLNTIKRIKPVCENSYNLVDEVSRFFFFIF